MSEHELKSRGGVGRIAKAIRYSLQGLRHAVRHEAAFRQELAVATVLLPVALWLPLAVAEKLVLIGSMVLVLAMELTNSAIEAVVDRISTELHPLSGRAKDVGSAAVFLCILWCALVWLVLAGPTLLAWVR